MFVGTLKLLLKYATFYVTLHDDIHEISIVSFVVWGTVKWSFLVITVPVVKVKE